MSGTHHASEKLNLHTGLEAMECNLLAINGDELEHFRLRDGGCEAFNI